MCSGKGKHLHAETSPGGAPASELEELSVTPLTKTRPSSRPSKIYELRIMRWLSLMLPMRRKREREETLRRRGNGIRRGQMGQLSRCPSVFWEQIAVGGWFYLETVVNKVQFGRFFLAFLPCF